MYWRVSQIDSRQDMLWQQIINIFVILFFYFMLTSSLRCIKQLKQHKVFTQSVGVNGFKVSTKQKQNKIKEKKDQEEGMKKDRAFPLYN